MTFSEFFTIYLFAFAPVCFYFMFRYSMQKFEEIKLGMVLAMLFVSFMPFLREFVFVLTCGEKLNPVIWRKKHD